MSLRKFIAEKINDLRNQISVLENDSAPANEKGAVLIALFGTNPAFCREVGKLASRPARPASIRPAVVAAVVPEVSESVTVPEKKDTTVVQAAPKLEMPGKPVAPTAPARTLEPPQETPEMRRNKLVAILSGFVAGKWIDYEKTRNFLTSVVKSGVEISGDQWNVVFAALKKVAEIGKGYILDSSTASAFFKAAPVDLIDDYIFGQDGAMTLVMAGLNEQPEEDEMPGWLVAKCYILVAGLKAIDGRMGDFELNRLAAMLRAVEKADGPEKLIGEIRSLLPTDADESAPPPVATATIGEIIRLKAAQAAEAEANKRGGNGDKKPADPAETARLAQVVSGAAEAASAFAQAASAN